MEKFNRTIDSTLLSSFSSFRGCVSGVYREEITKEDRGSVIVRNEANCASNFPNRVSVTVIVVAKHGCIGVKVSRSGSSAMVTRVDVYLAATLPSFITLKLTERE